MHLARHCLLAVLVVAVGACGGVPSTGPIGSPAAAASGPTGDGIRAVKDGLAALAIPTAGSTDLLREKLIAAIDL